MMRTNPYQLSREVGFGLLKRGWKIAVAESCTGGGLAYQLTSVPGASQWFDRGFVTYCGSAKVEQLGVDWDTIQEFGEVSKETAAAMAQGALHHSAAHLTLSITGIAGPTGGVAGKPVGTVWFGLGVRNETVLTCKKLFDSGRKHVRDSSISFALLWLLEILNNKEQR